MKYSNSWIALKYVTNEYRDKKFLMLFSLNQVMQTVTFRLLGTMVVFVLLVRNDVLFTYSLG